MVLFEHKYNWKIEFQITYLKLHLKVLQELRPLPDLTTWLKLNTWWFYKGRYDYIEIRVNVVYSMV